jgi:TonB-linked SusC/RagA family outer membrane protein
MQDIHLCKVPSIAKTKPKLTQVFRIMKLITIFLIVVCTQVAANGHSQVITISVKNTPLVKVFELITKQTGYRFFYNQEQIKKSKLVSLDVKNEKLEEVLAVCFKNQPFTYSLVNQIIVVRERNQIVATTDEINPSPPFIDVHGKVVNENGEPMESVSVSIKGTPAVAITDQNGEFSLNSVDKDAVLVFSHISMETFELKVSGKTELLISLKNKISALGGVSVVANTGYQTIKPNEATGAFGTIDNRTLNQQVGTNILNRLDGITSGILFDTKQLQPQKHLNITVRGLSSINGPQDPLIVLNGFIYEGDIANINPNFIESVTILKDAAAASIWGARAGNGVIVITTKKGKFNQKFQVELNATTTVKSKPDLFYLPRLSSADYIDLEQFRFNNGLFDDQINNYPYYGLTPAAQVFLNRKNGKISSADSASQIAALKKHDVRNDYKKYFYTNSVTQQYYVNLKGGGANNAYAIFLSYDKSLDETYNKYRKLNAGIENTFQPVKNLQASIRVFYTNSKSESGRPTDVSVNGSPAPYLALTDDNGNPLPVDIRYKGAYTDTAMNGKLLDWKYYPLEDYKHDKTTVDLKELFVTTNLQYKINKLMNVDIGYQYQRQQSDRIQLQDIESYGARNIINSFSQLDATTGVIKYMVPLGGIRYSTSNLIESQTGRAQLNFNHSWYIHSISGIIGGEIRQLHNSASNYTTYGYKDDPLSYGTVDFTNPYPNILTGINSYIDGSPTYSNIVDRFVSSYANLAYTLKSRYIFSVSARRDGSNIFGANTNNKWKPLWSTGLGWNIANESFYSWDFLPNLKLRTTYGYSGNVDMSSSALPVARYIGVNQATNFPASRIIVINNPELRWEKVRTFNVGLDFSLLKQVLFGSIDYYIKKGTDLYGPTQYDYTTWGYTQYVTKNVAAMEGKGLELNITSKNINKSFKWLTNYLFTYNSNKTTSYNTQESKLTSQLLGAGSAITPVIGKPLYAIAGYKWGGLDAAGNPQGYVSGQKSVDYTAIASEASLKGVDGNIVYKGAATPTVFGNIVNTVMWNNLTLSVNISYKLGYYFRRSALSYNSILTGGSGHSDYTRRWQKAGDENITSVPSFIYPNSTQRDAFYSLSEINILKGDHLRLQYINLSYSIGGKTLKKIGIRELQVYCNASNLGILWRANKEELDPEYPSAIPPVKAIALGVHANF